MANWNSKTKSGSGITLFTMIEPAINLTELANGLASQIFNITSAIDPSRGLGTEVKSIDELVKSLVNLIASAEADIKNTLKRCNIPDTIECTDGSRQPLDIASRVRNLASDADMSAGTIDMIRTTLYTYHRILGGNDKSAEDTPPMMYPEWISSLFNKMYARHQAMLDTVTDDSAAFCRCYLQGHQDGATQYSA